MKNMDYNGEGGHDVAGNNDIPLLYLPGFAGRPAHAAFFFFPKTKKEESFRHICKHNNNVISSAFFIFGGNTKLMQIDSSATERRIAPMARESQFQAKLIRKIKEMFPGCFVLKNDANYIQGFPDLTILYKNHKWALLECKRESEARKQPNQEHYILKGDEMAFARFICPENEEEVLHDLQQAFRA